MGSRTECRADGRCGSRFARRHTHLDLLDEHTGRHARFFGQPDRQISPTIQGCSSNHSAPVCKSCRSARREPGQSTSQSKSSGRSGQQVSCGAWSAKHSRSDTNVTLSSGAKRVTPADTSWHPCFVRQRQRPHQRGGRHAKWRNSEWATANGKRGAAMQRRWRLPKGVLRPRFAIKKRRFPLRPCSGIDSAVGRP